MNDNDYTEEEIVKMCKETRRRLNEERSINTIEEMKNKHVPLLQNFGLRGEVQYCEGCKTDGGYLHNIYPCDVVKTLHEYERLSNRMNFIEENLSGNTIVNVSKNFS